VYYLTSSAKAKDKIIMRHLTNNYLIWMVNKMRTRSP
jgi:hypothetical protein